MLLTCGFYGVQAFGNHAKESQQNNNAVTSYASQAIAAMQTVATMTMEQTIIDRLQLRLRQSAGATSKTNLKLSLSYSLSRSLLFGCMGLGFWYGSRLVLSLEYSLFRFTVVYLSIIQGCWSAGLAFLFAPNMGRAKASARNIKQLLDRRPKIDPRSSQGIKPAPHGNLEFQNVMFEYPIRPGQTVLHNISLTISPGEHVAFVGETGSGKSTITSLVQRFYDPI